MKTRIVFHEFHELSAQVIENRVNKAIEFIESKPGCMVRSVRHQSVGDSGGTINTTVLITYLEP